MESLERAVDLRRRLASFAAHQTRCDHCGDELGSEVEERLEGGGEDEDEEEEQREEEEGEYERSGLNGTRNDVEGLMDGSLTGQYFARMTGVANERSGVGGGSGEATGASLNMRQEGSLETGGAGFAEMEFEDFMDYELSNREHCPVISRFCFTA